MIFQLKLGNIEIKRPAARKPTIRPAPQRKNIFTICQFLAFCCLSFAMYINNQSNLVNGYQNYLTLKLINIYLYFIILY